MMKYIRILIISQLRKRHKKYNTRELIRDIERLP